MAEKETELTSLGFETLLIDNFCYDDSELSALFELFVPLDVRNFIFLSDFDFEINSFSIEAVKRQNFNKKLKSFTSHNVHAKAHYLLDMRQGFAFNPSLHRIYCLKKYRSLFVRYPSFSESARHDVANDINHLIYKLKAFPVLCNFDNIVNTSAFESYSNFFNVKSMAFGIDLNYLFRTDKIDFVKNITNNDAYVLPMISHDIANYYTVMNDAKYAIDKIGKNNYKKLCYLSSKYSTKLGY